MKQILIKIIKFLYKLVIEIPAFCCYSPDKYDINKLEQIVKED